MSDRDQKKPQDEPKRPTDDEFTFTTTGDGSAWDTGREASITDGTRVENDVRAADAETPGVKTRRPKRDEEDEREEGSG